MPLLSSVGPEFIYHPFVVAVLVVLLIGGGLRSAFRDDGASREDQPRPDAGRSLVIVLGVALIISGTLIVLYGLWAWAWHGYAGDGGTEPSNTLLMGLVLFGVGCAVIAGGAAIVRAARRPPAPKLSLDLAQAGCRVDGLAAIEEAVAVYRRLATANAAAYEPALATSLNKLSLRLAEAGRRDEAIAVIEEAVAVNRRLATANAAAYEPALATSLNNLSLRLAHVGRRDEAEHAKQEAAALSSAANAREPVPPHHGDYGLADGRAAARKQRSTDVVK